MICSMNKGILIRQIIRNEVRYLPFVYKYSPSEDSIILSKVLRRVLSFPNYIYPFYLFPVLEENYFQPLILYKFFS